MGSTLKVDFVKGHMGGNEIILVHGSQIPKRHRVRAAVRMMEPPSLRGDQLGILEKPRGGGDVKVRIVDKTEKTYIPMCGGLTQVLPRAFMFTDLGKPYGLGRKFKTIGLETDIGTVMISVRKSKGKVLAYTDMTSFVEECYRNGVSTIRLAGVDALKVGEYIVADVGKLRKQYGMANFDEIDSKAQEILLSMQKDFDEQHLWPKPNTSFSLFEMYPDDTKHGRVVFPHHLSTAHMEPSCGTGTMAIALALAETKRVPEGGTTLRFDSGGKHSLGGPETTEVRMMVENSKAVHAEFSHSLVEILSTGAAWISTPI